MTTQILNILIKTKKTINNLTKNQDIIRHFIIVLIAWNLILSILAIGTISYITIEKYKKVQENHCLDEIPYLDEIPEYELN